LSVVSQSIIKHKLGLLNLAEDLEYVSQACRLMGVSRDTFYRVKEDLQFEPPRLNADPSDFQPDSINGRARL
jgi:hypothetical protein